MSKIKSSGIAISILYVSAALFLAFNKEETIKNTEFLNSEEQLFSKYKLVKDRNPTINIKTGQ